MQTHSITVGDIRKVLESQPTTDEPQRLYQFCSVSIIEIIYLWADILEKRTEFKKARALELLDPLDQCVKKAMMSNGSRAFKKRLRKCARELKAMDNARAILMDFTKSPTAVAYLFLLAHGSTQKTLVDDAFVQQWKREFVTQVLICGISIAEYVLWCIATLQRESCW